MKNLYRIGLFIISAAGIYCCYHYASLLQLPFFSVSELEKKEFRSPTQLAADLTERDEGTASGWFEDAGDDDKEPSKEMEQEDVQAVHAQKTLTADTVYIVREYDISSKSEESKTEPIPEQMIGKTRAQAEQMIESYNVSPPLKELERGFDSMEIASFSPEKLVVLKKYDSEKVSEHFYLIAENDRITVYYSDLSTVYLYTDISMDALSDELQQEILDKKYVDSEEELYNFLESYSS